MESIEEIPIPWQQYATNLSKQISDDILADRVNQLNQALKAAALTESVGSGWLAYLNEGGDLPVTTTTLRSRVRWGLAVNKYNIDLEAAAQMGMRRTLKLDSLDLLDDPEWISRAVWLSGHDWNNAIKEYNGEEVLEFNDMAKCPVCNTRHRKDELEIKTREFLLREEFD